MKISVDVYTKEVDAATEVYKSALAAGASDVRLFSSEDYETGQFEHLNLMFDVDHTSQVLNELDNGPFSKDSSDL